MHFSTFYNIWNLDTSYNLWDLRIVIQNLHHMNNLLGKSSDPEVVMGKQHQDCNRGDSESICMCICMLVKTLRVAIYKVLLEGSKTENSKQNAK
jgi:hypothetical protein